MNAKAFRRQTRRLSQCCRVGNRHGTRSMCVHTIDETHGPGKQGARSKADGANNANGDILSPDHYRMLHEESGISDEVIAARGYRTVIDHRELTALNFSSKQSRVPGLS